MEQKYITLQNILHYKIYYKYITKIYITFTENEKSYVSGVR